MLECCLFGRVRGQLDLDGFSLIVLFVAPTRERPEGPCRLCYGVEFEGEPHSVGGEGYAIVGEGVRLRPCGAVCPALAGQEE